MQPPLANKLHWYCRSAGACFIDAPVASACCAMQNTSPYNCACVLALRLSVGSCTVRAVLVRFSRQRHEPIDAAASRFLFRGTFLHVFLVTRIPSTLPQQLWTATLLLLWPLQSQHTIFSPGRRKLYNQPLKAHPGRGHDTSAACLVPVHCALGCGITGSASPVDGPALAARRRQPNTAQAEAKDKRR